MSTPAWAWWAWIAAFAVLEGIGLLDNRPSGTLSELVWATFHVRDRRPTALVWALRAALLAALIWLTGHLGLGIWSF